MSKKIIIQLILIVFLIILTIFFYQKYMVLNNSDLKLMEKENDSQVNNEKLVSKKNQKDLEKVYFGLIYNLSNFDAKIFFISLNDDKPELNENLDNLIYSFNNNSITVNNWISLRSFINKILSSYPG